MTEAGAFAVGYSSTRREVWRWYWRRWREALSKIHLRLFLLIAAATYATALIVGHAPPMALATAALTGALVTGLLPLCPVLMFKPERRHLEISGGGISTPIGSKSAIRAWNEVASDVRDDGSVIITMKNGNAFIIPPRAFAHPSEAEALLNFSRQAISGRA